MLGDFALAATRPDTSDRGPSAASGTPAPNAGWDPDSHNRTTAKRPIASSTAAGKPISGPHRAPGPLTIVPAPGRRISWRRTGRDAGRGSRRACSPRSGSTRPRTWSTVSSVRLIRSSHPDRGTAAMPSIKVTPGPIPQRPSTPRWLRRPDRAPNTARQRALGLDLPRRGASGESAPSTARPARARVPVARRFRPGLHLTASRARSVPPRWTISRAVRRPGDDADAGSSPAYVQRLVESKGRRLRARGRDRRLRRLDVRIRPPQEAAQMDGLDAVPLLTDVVRGSCNRHPRLLHQLPLQRRSAGLLLRAGYFFPEGKDRDERDALLAHRRRRRPPAGVGTIAHQLIGRSAEMSCRAGLRRRPGPALRHGANGRRAAVSPSTTGPLHGEPPGLPGLGVRRRRGHGLGVGGARFPAERRRRERVAGPTGPALTPHTVTGAYRTTSLDRLADPTECAPHPKRFAATRPPPGAALLPERSIRDDRRTRT